MKEAFIKFPITQEAIRTQQQQFYAKHKIPSIVGLVDGTQVQILGPSENEEVYVNRSNYHSINVQIICNYECEITNVVAKWPGKKIVFLSII